MTDSKKKWQLTPEEADALDRSPSQDDMHRAAERAEGREFQAAGVVSKSEVRRFAGPRGFRYFWKPPVYTFGAGIPGILLIVGQMWLPELNAAVGNPLAGHVGLARLAVILLGSWLLFVAAPLYKPADWTPAK